MLKGHQSWVVRRRRVFRMPFPTEVREASLVASGRCCCICHTFGGRNIEVRHIVQEAGGEEWKRGQVRFTDKGILVFLRS